MSCPTASSGIPQLAWHTCTLTLAPRRNIGRGTPALIVLNALLKSVKAGSDHDTQRPRIKRAFRIPGAPAHKIFLRAGQTFSLEICFVGTTAAELAQWLDHFARHLQNSSEAGFTLCAPPLVRAHEAAELIRPGDDEVRSVELEFLSPIPFDRPKGSRRTALSLHAFIDLVERRLISLFGIRIRLPVPDDVCLLDNYWHYVELHHASKSQPGNTQYYNGCSGSIFLSGPLGPLLPWLRLAAHLHAAGAVGLNPFGYYRLHTPARSHLDQQLDRDAPWLTVIDRLQNESDDWSGLIAERHGAPLDPQRITHAVRERIARPDWQPAPALAFSVPKRGGLRRLEKLAPEEKLLHALLHEILAEPIDRVLEPAAIGFRRGLSAQDAIERVRKLIAEGYRFAVESDIEDFFPSVDLERLRDEIDRVLPPADTRIRSLLHALLHAPCIDGQHLHPRRRGIAQGSPLSPLLANLYLDRFDEAISQAQGQLIRYADDFVILTRTRSDAERLLRAARDELAAAGLEIGEEKTAIADIEDGFRFLGQPFGGQARDEVAPLVATPALKTLYITEPNVYLGHNGDALEIRRDGNPVDTIPFRRLSDIVVLENASFSSGLVRKCAQHGVPLIFTLGSGYHVATLAPDSRRYHGIAERQALHYARLTATERLVIAKGFAAQKIANYKPLIAARYAAGDAERLRTLDDIIAAIETAPDVQSVRGHEGRAAKIAFTAINDHLKVPEFRFKKRLREKPDRMNCLFNFGYYLLFSRLNTLVRAAGINPYLGFLHDGADDYETLVCDVEELFRAPLDRMLVAIVNLRIIGKDDFRTTDKGMRMQPAAIKRFIARFEHLLHSDAGGISLIRAMEAQVAALRGFVAQGESLWFFRYQAPHAATPKHEETKTPGDEKAPGGHSPQNTPVALAPWSDVPPDAADTPDQAQ